MGKRARAKDVQDCVEAYLLLHRVGVPRSTTKLMALVGAKWGDSWTDERFMAAENAMYDQPEVQEIERRLFERSQRSPVTRVPFAAQVRAAVWDMTDGKCWYCGIQTNPFRDFTIDHVMPLVKGGSDSLDNLVPCCKSCNSRKGPR